MQPSNSCVFCKGKLDPYTFVAEYYKGCSAHIQCIEEKLCVFCGLSGLCIKCQHKDCSRAFHETCLTRYCCQNSQDQGFLCDYHRKAKGKKKEYQRLWLARQVSYRVGLDPEAVLKIKESHGDNRVHSICSGQVFWFFIGTQYFPNFIKLQKPQISVKIHSDYSENWDTNLDDYIDRLTKEHENIKAHNNSLFSQYENCTSLNFDIIKDYKEEDLILAETRNLQLRNGFEEYLMYFESKAKPETDSNSNAEKHTSSLREAPRNEEDFVCSICGDGDYEDDDLIVICSSCEMGAHMKCYGIPVVPDTDWICHGCSSIKNKDERANIRCALCPIKGGCVKPTTHTTTGNLSFPNYPEGKNEQVWCHIFCASHLDSKIFGDKEYLDKINLKAIDPKRFTLKCQVCKTKDGACLQCQHGRCQIAFHPECGKEYFTNTRDKTGFDEVSIYCPMHKPLKLRRVLESKEKKCIEDVVSFCKTFEKYEKKIRNLKVPPVIKRQNNSERPFSCEEKSKLIKVVENEIKKMSKNLRYEFSVILKIKTGSLRNQVQVVRPQPYNLLDPQALISNKLSIKGRKNMECYKYYANCLYPLMKRELDIMKANHVKYIPKCKKKGFLGSKKNRDKAKIRAKAKVVDVVQEPEQEKFIQTVIEVPILNDVVSDEVYCICRQPFIEKSFKKPWESESDFQQRQLESQMICCDNCGEWYHYKCIGLKHEEEVPGSYTCMKCTKATIVS
ncbi:hypothetical protein SteCoe_8435 [Stentor coeruleus]|uniref:PHD-type domain-containing protein n=1 Tax=Stentor coeruleus TaxID=5963 RepID=A0A1R2CKE4_9CILI|nr:hypothetical protein SteCoe_8435 [Stentor coeruleus]